MKISYIAGAFTALILVSCYDAFSGSNVAIQSALAARTGNGAAFTTHQVEGMNKFGFTSRSDSWIANALSRQRKEETVSEIKENMEKSSLVFGMRYKGMSVKELDTLRNKLPEDAKIKVAMNTLVKRAGTEVEGFDAIDAACKGDNAWWFVGENVASSVKAYLAFEEECKKAAKADPDAIVPTLGGGVMDGTFLDENAIKNLKNLPTRSEVIAKIAGSIKAVPTKLARGLKQVPQKMAVGVSKLADGDDNKDLKVGDIFPKAEPEA